MKNTFMMKQFVVFSVVFLVCTLCIEFSLQYPNDLTCYDQICPSGTTSCKKNTRSSHDRRNLEIRITCLDDYDGSLKEYYFEEPSTLNPHTHYESSSYSAVGGAKDNYYYGGNNGIENFYK